MVAGPGRSLDHETLAENLGALAYPLRLQLLDLLAEPRTLSEIHVSPSRNDASGRPERHVAMQTVASHLERLVESEFVTTSEREAAGRTLTTYAVNPQRLYALTEELRGLSVRHHGRGRSPVETATLAGPSTSRPAEGARLVLVHGILEGRAFPLDAASARNGAWIVGRRRDLPVSLAYDPFVSLENATITFRDGEYHLTDLPESRNGTSLNWDPLARGTSRALRRGDVIGVGRSLLVFYER